MPHREAAERPPIPTSPARPGAARRLLPILAALLTPFVPGAASADDGSAFVFFLGVTKADGLAFVPIEADTGPFLWSRRDASAVPIEIPRSERLLNLTASSGVLVLATTAKEPASGLVTLSTMGDGPDLQPVGTVRVEGRPVGAASALGEDGTVWVFVEAVRDGHSETTAFRQASREWKTVATARTELGVPHSTNPGEMSVFGWVFRARPAGAAKRVPVAVSSNARSLNLVERFHGCSGDPLVMDREDTRLFREEVAVPGPCTAEERPEDAVGLRFPVVRCTGTGGFRVHRLGCDGWQDLANGAKPYFPAAPADDVGQIVDRGDEVLLLGHLLSEGSRKTFSLAVVRGGQTLIHRIRVP